MFDNQAFGHFGAPDMLSANYGAETSSYQSAQSHQSFGQTSEPPPYIRNGKALPNLKGGATDDMVRDDRGIVGLVSEIQKRIGVPQDGTLKTSQIKDYQLKNGLTVDGVVGPQTYTKLGFKEPFASSHRSTSGSPILQPPVPAIGARTPWYLNKWFLGGTTAVALVGAGYLLFFSSQDEQSE